MSNDHLNLQPVPRTSKIFGMIKMGANNSDKKVILALQQRGHNEHEIQSESGVHYTVIRSFMKMNNPEFEITDAPPTADTQHLHDEISALKQRLATQNAEDEISAVEQPQPQPPGASDARLESQQTKTKKKAKA